MFSSKVLACAFLAACGGIAIDHGEGDGSSGSDPGLPPAQVDASLPDGASCSNATNTQPAPIPLASGTPCADTSEPIAAWSLGGSAPNQYRVGFDTTTTCNGEPSLHLSSSDASSSQFGEMGTGKAPPPSWIGQRVRLSGWIQSSGVTGWAGLWTRVDSRQMTGITFDNMDCRAISGTTGWAEYEVVLDVPQDATLVAYGILLAGEGDVWLDGVNVDEVDTCVPTTGCP